MLFLKVRFSILYCVVDSAQVDLDRPIFKREPDVKTLENEMIVVQVGLTSTIHSGPSPRELKYQMH